MPSVGFFGAALGGLGGSAIGSAVVTLYLADQQYQSQLAKAKGQTEAATLSMGQRVKALGPAFAVAGAAAAVGIGVQAVKAFNESEAAIAQTNAVLKSTKGIAGVTATEVTKLAIQMQNLTTFSDEEVRSAENLLLTFTNIGHNIFPETTKAVLDMSTALGQDLKSSSIQLGKALNDPIKGITALRRVGVNFNEATQETINSLVEEGKLLEAQKIILKEVATEFGGAAQAQAKTFAGQMKQLGNELNNVLEELGRFIVSMVRGLLPVLKLVTPVLGFAARNAGLFLAAFAAFATVRWIIPFLAALTVKIQTLAGASLTAQIATTEFMAALGALGAPLTVLIGLTVGLGVAYSRLESAQEEAVRGLTDLGVEAKVATERVNEAAEGLKGVDVRATRLRATLGQLAVEEERNQEIAAGWAARQKFAAFQMEHLGDETTKTGGKISRFANLSKEALATFRTDVKADFAGAVNSMTGFSAKWAFTANQFRRQIDRMREKSKTLKDDLNNFAQLKGIPERFQAWLLTQGPDAIHAFVRNSEAGRSAIISDWRAIEGNVRSNKTAIDRVTDALRNVKSALNEIDGRRVNFNIHAAYSWSGSAGPGPFNDAVTNAVVNAIFKEGS
jgi:hypothetical protein